MMDGVEREEAATGELSSRRRVLAGSLQLAVGAAVGALAAGPRAFAQSGAPAPAARPLPPGPPPPADEGTKLVLLGTRGGPGVDLARSQTASVVVVEGVPYLFDCGYGAVRQLVASGLGIQRVSTLFLTHLHNDHTSDIAALLSLQWTGSKATPTEVYGPYGTARLVEGAIAFFRADAEIRTVDEGRTARPEDLYHGHDVAATAAPVKVLEDEHVKVTAAESEHFLARAKAQMPHRALAYRVDTKERSIVFSGDTPYSKNLVVLAQGADVFVCEVMAQSVNDAQMARAKADAEAGNPNSIARHVAETHSTPAVVGRMAAEARVKTVVLNHQLPAARVPGGVDFAITSFIDGVHEQFAGEVIVGQDLMVL
jgi:ribonuclease BN (tRNA processing enzyme)